MRNFETYVTNLKRKTSLINKDKILFICIGKSEILWDSIGPLVGSYLKDKLGSNKVLGDINHNICTKWDLMYHYPKIKNKFVVAIDTALSAKEMDGEIFISNSSTIMGSAFNRPNGVIGDISIKAAISDFANKDKQYIEDFASFIGKGICVSWGSLSMGTP